MSHNSRKRGRGCSASPIVQRGPGVWFVVVGATRRTIYLGPRYTLPLAALLPRGLSPSLMLISSPKLYEGETCLVRVNFCNHKSISHARGGGSFRRWRASCCKTVNLRPGTRKSSNILPISTLFRSPKKEEAPSSSSSFSSDKGSSLDRLFIILSARPPS